VRLAQHPKSVLIVDDDAHVRGGLRNFFEETGVQVCGEATNGGEAISMAMALKPELVIMDLRMPMMNGAEAAATIRKTLPDTRIVIFTLFSDAFGKFMAKLSGVDVVVSKAEGTGGLAKALHKLFAASLS